MACAWATFFCYGSMMVISFRWGQKEYPVPYAWKKLLAYIVIVCLIYFVHSAFVWIGQFSNAVNWAFGSLLLLGYAWFILRIERKEFARLPIIGRFL